MEILFIHTYQSLQFDENFESMIKIHCGCFLKVFVAKCIHRNRLIKKYLQLILSIIKWWPAVGYLSHDIISRPILVCDKGKNLLRVLNLKRDLFISFTSETQFVLDFFKYLFIMKEVVCDYLTKRITIDGRRLDVSLLSRKSNALNDYFCYRQLELAVKLLQNFFSNCFFGCVNI